LKEYINDKNQMIDIYIYILEMGHCVFYNRDMGTQSLSWSGTFCRPAVWVKMFHDQSQNIKFIGEINYISSWRHISYVPAFHDLRKPTVVGIL
jgi:hypothetical protein